MQLKYSKQHAKKETRRKEKAYVDSKVHQKGEKKEGPQ